LFYIILGFVIEISVAPIQNTELKTLNFVFMNKPQITKNIEIEDLVRNYPFSIRFLANKGIKCIACGEPVWGTLEEAAKEKKIGDHEIDQIVLELQNMAQNN